MDLLVGEQKNRQTALADVADPFLHIVLGYTSAGAMNTAELFFSKLGLSKLAENYKYKLKLYLHFGMGHRSTKNW